MEWSDLTVTSLRDLGADREMVPGAMLRQHMELVGAGNDFDVGAYIAESSSSFSQLVAQVSEVVTRPRPGTDVLIGLTGASAPTPEPKHVDHARPGAFRKDVFQAFTRVAPVPFVYMPDADQFTPRNHSEGATIEVDRVSLQELIDDRRKFVMSLPLEDQTSLSDALDSSPNPLSTFREQAANQGLLGRWASRQAEIVKARVVSWAQKNDVTPRQGWFQQRHTISTHQTLERLLPYLTPDEIRAMPIPFRAIEAFLSGQKYP